MERQIKFRGKRLDNGEWIVGDLVENQGRFFIYHATSETTIEDNDDCKIAVSAVEVNPATIGQFTGLLDKNGKEIYEGDILGVPGKDIFCRVVEYCCDGFYLVDNCQDRKFGDLLHREISLDGNYSGMAKVLRYNGYDYCVIGNIHDNPSLISDKQ